MWNLKKLNSWKQKSRMVVIRDWGGIQIGKILVKGYKISVRGNKFKKSLYNIMIIVNVSYT